MDIPPVITEAPEGAEPPRREKPPESESNLKKAAGPLGVLAIILAKFKGLLLPILKFFPILLKTGGSMFLTIWIYAQSWGWKFAVGFVVLILIHECGHLVAARNMGLKVGAPVFIPFMGAFIALKEAPKNAWIEAVVGIGGPVLGTLGAVACAGIYYLTGDPMYLALAHVGFLLNLFNLMPTGFLDGGRIVTAISPWMWVVGIVCVGALMFIHFNILLLLIFIFSLPRLFSLFRAKTDEEKRYFELTSNQRWTMTFAYFWLIGFLAFAMKLTEPVQSNQSEQAFAPRTYLYTGSM